MKLNKFKPLLWLILLGIFAGFISVTSALADGAGWPTATPSPTLIRLVTSTVPFGGAVTPVIAITPLGNDQPIQAGDQALLPTMFQVTAQALPSSSPFKFGWVVGLVIAAVVLLLLFFLFFRQ